MPKERLDNLLVSRGLVPSRAKAQALILAGQVLVNEAPINKAGTLIKTDAQIRVKEKLKFVGRGGLKLEKVLKDFAIDVTGFTCLDVGASTGGFTDCLLQNGAKKVFAIDVGSNQLHWCLQTDARVISFEKENFRYFDCKKITDPIDLAVMDVSFISVTKLLPQILKIFAQSLGKKHLIVLIKPQFEVGKNEVGKGGIVRDAALRQRVVDDLVAHCQTLGLNEIRTTPSPITGQDGNVEFLLYAIFS